MSTVNDLGDSKYLPGGDNSPKGYYFLAQPYSDKDPKIMEERYEFGLKFLHVYHRPEYRLYFSPIVMCHPVAARYDLPRDFDYWKTHNQIFMDSAIGMEVLCIEGWEKSTGVRAEIEYMISKRKPIILAYFSESYKPIPATKITFDRYEHDSSEKYYLDRIYQNPTLFS